MSTSSSFPKVVCKRTRQSRAFREGSPLVFTGAIAYTQSTTGKDLSPGCLVSVHVKTDKEKKKEERGYAHKSAAAVDNDNTTQLIGWGVYNPHSMYRVRILCHVTTHPTLIKTLADCEEETEALCCILETNLKSALATRRALNLPSSDTDTYRLVNGEGDGLSGLAVDILGGSVAVVMSSAAWCQVHKATIKEILQCHLNNLDIVWKTTPARLQQDGIMEQLDDDEEDGHEKENVMVVATESNIQYATFPYMRGQKTGFYCDQRENRFHFAQYCKDKRVLDLCCYHGGFSLNAAIHGHAKHCTGVDSSQDAIDISKANAERNRCTNNVEFVRQDISIFMKQAFEEGQRYDVICLDPPKLAPSVSGLDRASRKYHGLNRDAMKLISEEGGLLLTCTCSAAMTQNEGLFLQTVQQAAIGAGRRITLLRVDGAASCHVQNPASRGNYLTAALFHVSPI